MQNNLIYVYMTTVWNNKVEAFSGAPAQNTNTVPALVPIQDDEIDNIKDFGTPDSASNLTINNPTEPTTNKTSKSTNDIGIIKNVVTMFFTVLLTIHISFVWYFNLTQGVGEATFYKNFDFLNMFSVITGYFYNIVKFIDTLLLEKLSYYSKYIIENTFIKDRSLFIVLIFIGYFIANYLISFITVLVEQISSKKFNIKKLPGPSSLFSLLYFGFVVYGIVSIFKEGGPIANFIALNPIISLIGIIILVAMLYVPTTFALPFFFFIHISYYSIIGTSPSSNSLYEKVSNMGFYKALYSIINVNHVLFEPLDNTPIKNAIEYSLRFIFKILPYILLIVGLIPVLIKSLDINTLSIKYSFIGIIIATVCSIIAVAFQEI